MTIKHSILVFNLLMRDNDDGVDIDKFVGKMVLTVTTSETW